MWRISESGRLDELVVFRWDAARYVPVGSLRFEGGDRRIGRFVYAKCVLRSGTPRPIDPIGLPISGRSRSAHPDEVHLAFHDAGPDGWGKGILDRAFPHRRLGMAEYLALGGTTRTGDLAFGPTPDGPRTWVPDEAPLLHLPAAEDDIAALLAAAEAIEDGRSASHHLQVLLRNSADVGGARPKARLRHRGRQWIAKFPAWGDRFDDPRAEAVCLDVAEAAGLSVPARELLDIGGRSVLLVERFDRTSEGEPIAYLSAATLLKEPSFGYGTRKTYVDIAAVAESIGVANAFPEMFRRLLVNACLHNTDDHLRNHAFLGAGDGWRLSPVFDIAPHPGVMRHVCAPAPGLGPEWDAERAFASHPRFKLSRIAADSIREAVQAAMRRVPEFMAARGMPAGDRTMLAASFAPAARAS